MEKREGQVFDAKGELIDYPVSMDVHGCEYRLMQSEAQRIFSLYSPEPNWKDPIIKGVSTVDIIAAMSRESAANVRERGAEWLRAFVAAVISFFVGGETKVDFCGDGKAVVLNAGYYRNIGA